MSDYAENNGSMDEHANEGRKPRTTEELLSSYLFDELGDQQRAEVEQALQQDAGLQARLDELQETLSLLHRSAFDTENGELAEDRRQALRAAAASAVSATAAKPKADARGGRLLYFPVLKAAAAVALIAAGVMVVNEWQAPMGADYEASMDGDPDEQLKLLRDTGYVESSTSSTESRESGAGARPTDSGVLEMQAEAPPMESTMFELGELEALGYVSENESNKAFQGGASGGEKSAESRYKEALRALPQGGRDGIDKSGTFLNAEAKHLQSLGYAGVTIQPEKLAKDQATMGFIAADDANRGAFYVGPGDSVPPSADNGLSLNEGIVAKVDLPAQPAATPSTPASPSTPGSPLTGTTFGQDSNGAPASPPPPGKAAPKLEESGDPDFSTDAAFDSEAWNNAVGVGGGGGGKYGDRGGPGGKKEEPAGDTKLALIDEKLGRSADGQAAEIQELKDLGYLDADADLIDSYGVTPDTTLEEAKGYYFDEAGNWRSRRAGGEPRIIVCDGYGRYYHDVHIVNHLRPVEVDESPRDMFFRYYGDNPFVDNAQDNLSTFAIDVDTASYPMARKYLAENKLPPRAAIRSEEFLNYFDHELAPPTEGDFAVHLQAAPTPFTEGSKNILLKVGVKGREVSSAERKPLNLVFVIDKSGSMRENNRMELVKRSLELLVDQLREDDRVGIVSFDSSGHIVMESTAGAERWKLREALRQMDPGGSTNAAEGLYLGYEMLSRNYQEGATNRVILASDGVANTGETDQQRILDRIADFTSRQVDLTTIGVGMNNHNDVFLEQMANKGDGSCHYVDDFDEAKHVFIDRFSGTMQTIARDVKIQVEFDDANVLRWRQIGYENRSLQDNQFRDDRVDAGEVGAGHEIVALYEVQLKNEWTDGAEGSLATVRLRWKPDGAERSQETGVVPAVEQPFAIDLGQVEPQWKETSPHFRLAAVTAQYAEFMRRSYHVRGDSYAVLQAAADRLALELSADEKVRELSKLVTETRRLVQFQPPSDELWQLIEQSRRLTLLHQELHHIEKRNQETEKLMAELQAQNAELEQRIRQHLEGRN